MFSTTTLAQTSKGGFRYRLIWARWTSCRSHSATRACQYKFDRRTAPEVGARQNTGI